MKNLTYFSLVFLFFSCSESSPRKHIYSVLADSIAHNYLIGDKLFIMNSIDGSGLHTAKIIVENKDNKYSDLEVEIAQGVYSDSIKLNSGIPLIYFLNQVLITKEKEVSELNELTVEKESLDTAAAYLTFSKVFTLSDKSEGGYFSVSDLGNHFSNGYYYQVSDTSFRLRKIWNSKSDFGKKIIYYSSSE